MVAPPFRVAIVPGVTPGKWVTRWQERFPRIPIEVALIDEAHQVAVLGDSRADVSFVRLPVAQEGLHVIGLYDEVAVVVMSIEHAFADLPDLLAEDLAEEQLFEDPADLQQAIEVVASGAGMIIVPRSVARLHHRKDVVAVPVTDLPGTRIGIAWPATADDPRIDDFIGIVRGRTAQSSRGSSVVPSPAKRASAAKRKRK